MGAFSLQLEFEKYDRTQSFVKANLIVNASIPSGSGIVGIPLPFSLDRADAIIVEGHGTTNSIIHGDLWPERRYGLLIVNLANEAADMRVKIQGVELQLDNSAQAESGKSVQLLVRRVYFASAATFPSTPLMPLAELHIKPVNLGETSPPSISENGMDRVVRFSNANIPASDVTLYLRSTPSALYGLYIFLGILGVILGLAGASKIPPRRAVLAFVLSLSGLVVLAFFFFRYLPSEQRIFDTTTVVTIGTVTGILLATAGYALLNIYRSRRTPSRTP
jgi:hypothetical protein